jgi:hypothetical protein
MDRHDRLGSAGDRRFDLIDIHAETVVAIDEDRTGAGLVDGADGGDEGVGGGDHLVTRTETQCLQRDLDRVGAGPHADGMAGADHLGKHRLEFSDRLAQGEIPGRHEAAQLFQDLAGIAELFAEIGVADLPAALICHDFLS